MLRVGNLTSTCFPTKAGAAHRKTGSPSSSQAHHPPSLPRRGRTDSVVQADPARQRKEARLAGMSSFSVAFATNSSISMSMVAFSQNRNAMLRA